MDVKLEKWHRCKVDIEVLKELSKLILLDEPAAGMTPYETDQLAKTLQDHVLNGRSAIIIEHKIDFIAALAKRTFVLSAGRAIADGPTDEVLCDKDVRRIYLGECG